MGYLRAAGRRMEAERAGAAEGSGGAAPRRRGGAGLLSAPVTGTGGTGRAVRGGCGLLQAAAEQPGTA